MALYDKFAYFYAKGQYPRYSETMVSLLPAVLERFQAEPRKILDLACGEGTFCVAMALRGYQMTGVDLSPQVLSFARERAMKEKVKVEFLLQDMRSLNIEGKYDLVTCWYDSMNYLLTAGDLEKTFSCVHRVLKPNGLFIFDMNTLYGLSVNWQRYPCTIQQDTRELFEIHRTRYDPDERIATLRITGFAKEKDGWMRIDEEHREKGYAIEEIERCFHNSGFHQLACWGSFEEMSDPGEESGRIWFVLRKHGATRV